MSTAALPVHNEIAAFFAVYVDAFVRNDADALADLWEPVGLFPSPTGNFAMDRQTFRGHCVSLMAFYRKQGVVRPTGKLLSATELFPGVAQARMNYRMLGDDNQVIAQWEHVYILRCSDRWRVTLSIADYEMATWAALGVTL